MTTGFLDWHWMLIGIILMLTELLVPALVAFWFGLGAVLLAGLLWVFPEIGLAWQLFIWLCFSALMLLAWYFHFRRYMFDRTQAGLSRKAVLGTCGQVLESPMGSEPGRVRFTIPILGDMEWPFICESSVAPGDRVWVIDVSGNTLVVNNAPPKSEAPASE